MRRKFYKTMMNFCYKMAMRGRSGFDKWCRAYTDYAEKWYKAGVKC